MPDSVNPTYEPSSPELPSGYLKSELLAEDIMLGKDILPWVTEPCQVSVAECRLESGEDFLLASVLSSHRRLIAAADAMTDKQRQITDNMFYSRIVSFIESGYAARNVETMPKSSTPFPIHVMRNKGGQRVYFGMPIIELAERGAMPVVLRLAVCDKNRQSEVIKVLSAASRLQQRYRKSH